MTPEFVWLAVVMTVASFPLRSLPLLWPGVERMPPLLASYLRLVAPAILAGLAAVSLAVKTVDGQPQLHVGAEWLSVLACIVVVVWRRNLLLGLIAAAVLITVLRITGLSPAP